MNKVLNVIVEKWSVHGEFVLTIAREQWAFIRAQQQKNSRKMKIKMKLIKSNEIW